MILAGLLIFLGIKYHWGDHLTAENSTSVELTIPDAVEPDTDATTKIDSDSNNENYDIVKNDNSASTLISSMNKEQIAEQCIKLLSQTISDDLALELATVNCVVSNYQETFENNTISAEQAEQISKRTANLNEQCQLRLNQQNNFHTTIEYQLLTGICVSDLLNQ